MPSDITIPAQFATRKLARSPEKASQSHTFDWSVPGECMSESHAANDRTGVRAEPQRSTDIVALAARSQCSDSGCQTVPFFVFTILPTPGKGKCSE
jgi:hypothetical protein